MVSFCFSGMSTYQVHRKKMTHIHSLISLSENCIAIGKGTFELHVTLKKGVWEGGSQVSHDISFKHFSGISSFDPFLKTQLKSISVQRIIG